MLTYLCGIGWNPYGIQWNPSHFIWNLVEYNDSISIFHWNPGGMELNHMDSMWNTMIPWNVMDSIPFHSTWIPVEYSYGISIFHSYSIWNECGKMSGTSAKFIPYGMDGIHMELIQISYGFHWNVGAQ